MTSIRITQFGGMRESASRNSLNVGEASLAKDLRLTSGALEPWRYPAKFIDTPNGEVCKIYKHKCCYVTSENPCASFTSDNTSCGRVFSTDHMPWPAYARMPTCNSCGEVHEYEWFRLGVPSPVYPISIVSSEPLTDPTATQSIDSGYQIKRETRIYMYTYVNNYGEESNPSNYTVHRDVDIDGEVTLTMNVAALPSEYEEPRSIRIYRGVSTVDTEMMDNLDIMNPAKSEFFFVEEIPFATGRMTVIDDVESDLLGEPYGTDLNNLPPEDLSNIAITDSGNLVGSSGNKLWFSEPYQYHAWSCFMTLDHDIEALGVTGGSIYVATTANPYVIEDRVVEEECKCCRPVLKVSESAAIACKRSFALTPTGAIWATNDGIVRLAGGSFQYISLRYIPENKFGQWVPHKLTGAYYKGYYFATNGCKSFIMDVREGIYTSRNVGEESSYSELSLTPSAMYVSDQNELVMAFDGGLFRWDESDTYLPYTWKSSLIVEGGRTSLGVAKIVFSDWIGTRPVPHPVMFTMYIDDRPVYKRVVNSSKPFRLPRTKKGINYHFEIEGIQSVMELHLGTVMRDLTLVSNA